MAPVVVSPERDSKTASVMESSTAEEKIKGRDPAVPSTAQKRVTTKNPEGMVWGCECAICKQDFKQPECQVDHKKGNNPLRSMGDLLSFVKSMIMITDKDLAIVCKPCHTIKSYSERFGITFQEARLEKEGIRFKKLDKDIQIRFLIDNGFKDKDISNAAKRRSCFIIFDVQKIRRQNTKAEEPL